MRNAVVIGGTSDIGKDIIYNILERGYKIHSTYFHSSPSFYESNLAWYKVDLSNPAQVNEFINTMKNNIDAIDTFIYNAGTTCRKLLKDVTDDDILTVFNTNVFSCYKMIRDMYGSFNNDAKIVVIGSKMGILPHSVSTLYGMSKECLHSMVRNVVKEFDGTNITINCIAPGFVNTKWQDSKPQNIKDSIYKKTSLHRFANVSEVTKGVMFCLDNNFVNGSIIEIDGGYNYK